MNNINSINTQNAKIQYPILWDYLIVTLDGSLLESVIKEKFGALNYRLEISKKSKKGKYISYNFYIQVASQDERDNIFRVISAISGVKVVI